MKRKKLTCRCHIVRESVLARFGCAIGQGLLAGAVGTAAMTIAQRIEMRITQRQPSPTPEKAGAVVLGVEPKSESAARRFGTMVHWFYGIVWGIPRGLLPLFGIRGWLATGSHFLKIWISGMILLPLLGVSTPPWRWGKEALAKDGFFHLLYAAAAGLFIDLTTRRKIKPKRPCFGRWF